MSLINIPFVFAPGTTIASGQVNADFSAIVSVVNGNLDGSNFSTVFTDTNFAAKGHVTMAGGLIVNWAAPGSVAFDNTAVTAVTFDLNFPNNVFFVGAQVVENTTSHPQLVTPYVYSVGLTGFNLVAMGGSNGQTGTVYWIAIGN